jgi:restriction endonuclease Mrr
LPTQVNHLTRLHQSIVRANAASGFYVTTRGFLRDAEAYAKTAPIKLVDGPKLVTSITRIMEDMPTLDTYRAMCRLCGEIVTHSLDQAEAVTCSKGHAVGG